MLFNDKEFGFKILVTLIEHVINKIYQKILHLYLNHKWSTYKKVHSQKANNSLHLLKKYLSLKKIDYICKKLYKLPLI